MIQQVDLRAAYLADKPELDAAMAKALDSGWYVLGDEVKSFEVEFATYCQTKHCIGVANGTDAIALALKAVGVRAGDRVATVAHTVSATVAAIEQIGARPVLVDIDETCCMDVESVAAAYRHWDLTAIVPVHLYGRTAKVLEIKHNCPGSMVVEDAAHAPGGLHVARHGDAACFSFYPTKNLACFGDGGAVVANSDAIAERVKLLRQYGWKQRYISDIPGGWDSRLDEIQAALLRVRLKRMIERQVRRRAISEMYDEARGVKEHHGVAHLYVLRTARRDEFVKHMAAHGVSTAIHYPVPVHQQPAYRNRLFVVPGGLPNTERAAREVVTIPLYPEMTDSQASQVSDALAAWKE